MFCEKCGSEIKEGASFCAKCGNPIGDAGNNAQPVSQKDSEHTEVGVKDLLKDIWGKETTKTEPPVSPLWLWLFALSPLYGLAVGRIGIFLTILFAWLDWKALRKAGIKVSISAYVIGVLLCPPIYIFRRIKQSLGDLRTMGAKVYAPFFTSCLVYIAWLSIFVASIVFCGDDDTSSYTSSSTSNNIEYADRLTKALASDAADLLKESLNETINSTQLKDLICVTRIKDCVLVKETESRYSGIAKATFSTKNRIDGNSPSVDLQYNFYIIFDGTNIMLQDASRDHAEEPKFERFLASIGIED